jgi:hypothetical protein
MNITEILLTQLEVRDCATAKYCLNNINKFVNVFHIVTSYLKSINGFTYMYIMLKIKINWFNFRKYIHVLYKTCLVMSDKWIFRAFVYLIKYCNIF